jgi:hypothetical protein
MIRKYQYQYTISPPRVSPPELDTSVVTTTLRGRRDRGQLTTTSGLTSNRPCQPTPQINTSVVVHDVSSPASSQDLVDPSNVIITRNTSQECRLARNKRKGVKFAIEVAPVSSSGSSTKSSRAEQDDLNHDIPVRTVELRTSSPIRRASLSDPTTTIQTNTNNQGSLRPRNSAPPNGQIAPGPTSLLTATAPPSALLNAASPGPAPISTSIGAAGRSHAGAAPLYSPAPATPELSPSSAKFAAVQPPKTKTIDSPVQPVSPTEPQPAVNNPVRRQRVPIGQRVSKSASREIFTLLIVSASVQCVGVLQHG